MSPDDKITGPSEDAAVEKFYATIRYPGPDALITYLWPNRLKPYLPLDKFLLLDAGCGAGRHTAGFLDLYPQCRVVSLDISKDSIAAARALCEAKSYSDRVDFINQSFTDPIILERKADAAIAIGTIHHCADPEGALVNIVNAVKPGGIVAFMVYSSRSAHRRYELKEVLAILEPGGDLDKVSELVWDYEKKYDGLLDRTPRQTFRQIRNALSHRLKLLLGRKAHGYETATSDKVMVADSYLSPIDAAFDTEGLRALLDRSGLEALKFIGLGRENEDLIPSSWRERWYALDPWQKRRVLELIDPVPTSWSVICRKP